jgi:hypothetical protein
LAVGVDCGLGRRRALHDTIDARNGEDRCSRWTDCRSGREDAPVAELRLTRKEFLQFSMGAAAVTITG